MNKEIVKKLEEASAYVISGSAAGIAIKQALIEARRQQILLEKLKDIINQAILETPTGIHRNKLTEINMARMRLE